MNGLVWNSMMSMAGGWFFLTIVEAFTLGEPRFPPAGPRLLHGRAIVEAGTARDGLGGRGDGR